MEELLSQIENCVEKESYLIGIYTSLSIPDICAALQSPNGESKKTKYVNWCNQWLSSKYYIPIVDKHTLTGEQCYAFRCGVVHQGRSQHADLGYSRILFVDPKSKNCFHNNVINDALNIDAGIFCSDMVASAREWLEANKDNENVVKNMPYLLQKYPQGIAPYIVGVPVYG